MFDEAPFLRTRAAAALEMGARVHADLAQECAPSVARAAQAVAGALRAGGKVLAFGNGGRRGSGPAPDGRARGAISDGTSSSGRRRPDDGHCGPHRHRERLWLRFRLLPTDRGSRQGGRHCHRHQHQRHLAQRDRGSQTARLSGLTTVGFTGSGDNTLSRLVDIPIAVPSTNVGHIQESHLALAHAMCDSLDSIFSDRPDLALAAVPGRDKTVTLDELVVERERWRREGKVVVWTNGCFDLFHVGHLHGLQAARRLGDVLVVGLNDDASVQELKGAGRPLIPAAERAALIAALEAVTRVVLIEGSTPEHALALLRPDVHCKGADYAPPDGKPMPERAIVEGYGGRIEFLPWVDDASTSSLIERVRATSPAR